jgi:uncharacterized membrane protein YhdT
VVAEAVLGELALVGYGRWNRHPFVSVPIWFEMPWWAVWLAPIVWFGLLYVWIRVRFRLAGLDPNTGEERNRGAQI